MTNNQIKVGLDNAGGITLESTEHKWSLTSMGAEVELAETLYDLLTGVTPDGDWTNQWDEGVRAADSDTVIEASSPAELSIALATVRTPVAEKLNTHLQINLCLTF